MSNKKDRGNCDMKQKKCILFNFQTDTSRSYDPKARKMSDAFFPILRKVVAILMMNLHGFGLEILVLFVFATAVVREEKHGSFLWVQKSQLGRPEPKKRRLNVCRGSPSATWPRAAACFSKQQFLGDRLC